MVFGHNKLLLSLTENSLSVTFEMLWPLVPTNCCCHWLQIASLWFFKCCGPWSQQSEVVLNNRMWFIFNVRNIYLQFGPDSYICNVMVGDRYINLCSEATTFLKSERLLHWWQGAKYPCIYAGYWPDAVNLFHSTMHGAAAAAAPRRRRCGEYWRQIWIEPN